MNYLDIYRRYFREFLLYDVLAIAGFVIFIALRDCIYIKLLLFLKIVLLLEMDEQVMEKLSFRIYVSAIYKFTRMILTIYFVTSLGACIYFFIDY